MFTLNDASPSTSAFKWKGGIGQLVGKGTWGSGTLCLQISLDSGVTWLQVGAGSSLAQLTADGTICALVASDSLCRLIVTGGTSFSITAGFDPALLNR